MDDRTENISKSVGSFKEFLNRIFWLSYQEIKPTPYLNIWADMFQKNPNTALLSARRHLKSTLVYAYVMWKIFMNPRNNYEILYISLKEDLSRYHIRNIKKLMLSNPYFSGYIDLGKADSEIHGTWMKTDYEKIRFEHRVEPAGIEAVKRGRHPDLVICDDILADPTQQLEPVKIEKVNRLFFEEIMSLPKEGGEIKVVGTAQHKDDLFFKLKDIKNFSWSFNPAVINFENKEVLWKERFSYDELIELRNTIGEKAFNKEYQCMPIWSAESYFKRSQLIIDNELKNYRKTESKSSRTTIIAGFDVGKHMHPSHLTVFEVSNDKYKQIFQIFFDGWDYNKQVGYINALAEVLMIDQIRFDNTRGEFEGFMENGTCHRGLWRPVVFTAKEKFNMATLFERLIIQGKVILQNDERMINSILAVNNDLEAIETTDGHGDAFWSIALALSCRAYGVPNIIGVRGSSQVYSND